MIPSTLTEAHKALDELLSSEDKEKIRNWEESFEDLVADVHHSLGRHLRNTWGLWKDSPLAQHMRDVHNITHPDDMSHEILVTYCRLQVRTRFERIA